MLYDIGNALLSMLHWEPLLAMVVGTIIGILLGALPGLSATLGIALAIPFTYGMDVLTALGLLAGIHNGASQGGAIPAILLRIPGTPGAICTTWDGYPLAQQGKAGGAINLAAVSSAFGGVLSAIALIMLAPPLARVALAFGPPEIFWVNVFGLAAIAAMLGDDVLKGIMAACFGLMISAVGLDNVSGHERYTFGMLELVNGIPQLAVMVGMFSFPPAWELARTAYQTGRMEIFKIVSEKIWTIGQVWKVWLKSALIGIVIGILPGSAISAFIAYNEAKRSSKHPEEFGKGSIEGLASAESVNNADNAAAMIPTLTLGVPGSAIAALMLGALLIHGFQPGPQLFRDSPGIVYGYSLAMLMTALMLIPLGGAVASRVFSHVLRLPGIILLPLIVVAAVTGSFASENSMFPVYLAVLFGLVGLAMVRFGFPIAPVIIGVVLGAKAEFNLRVSLLMSAGDPSILFTRPISILLIILSAIVLFYPSVRYFRDRRRKKRESIALQVAGGDGSKSD
jgi:putative tricarboxylic transport membrane protein